MGRGETRPYRRPQRDLRHQIEDEDDGRERGRFPMPVNSTHPDYDSFASVWQRARDVIAGEDAVKLAGERYLPRLESQTED